tara:strand:- start:743 stop:1564 length:822 start_codon:yes stop_codon:yes gene_type:complete
MLKTSLALTVAISLFSTAATAHEVWLEPDVWVVPKGSVIAAQMLNGEELRGQKLSWQPSSIKRAEKWEGDSRDVLEGRLGDIPAINTSANEDGLLTLVYESEHNVLTYDSYEKFTSFLDEKGFERVIAEHDNRSLPKERIREAYSRHAKALVAVGSGQGSDAPRGLEIELVALDNPYTANLAEPLRFQILYRDAVMPDNRVTLFDRSPDGTVAILTQQADARGTVAFDITPGHTYLVDTVMIRPTSRELLVQTKGAVWESLWASLTFQVPADR